MAVRDPDFSETRMWRGPVWVNTNWLVAQGLRRQGLIDKAERLERATLELVAAQGPNEYFRPDTGVKPPRATTVFGWSAALTVDLAVLGGAVVWEPSRGGALFPHIYGDLPIAAVTAAEPFAAPRAPEA